MMILPHPLLAANSGIGDVKQKQLRFGQARQGTDVLENGVISLAIFDWYEDGAVHGCSWMRPGAHSTLVPNV